jgi:hypothetical protein
VQQVRIIGGWSSLTILEAVVVVVEEEAAVVVAEVVAVGLI